MKIKIPFKKPQDCFFALFIYLLITSGGPVFGWVTMGEIRPLVAEVDTFHFCLNIKKLSFDSGK